MKISSNIKTARWNEYEVIASGGGEKLERFGPVTLLRPDPQAIWPAPYDLVKYPGLNAVYGKGASYSGAWDVLTELPKQWTVAYKELRFSLRTQTFKHTGIFPEQAVNWDKMSAVVSEAVKTRPVSVLNLFAYTGAASVVCTKAGAAVTHVDAAKAMVERAGENARLSGVNAGIKYVVEDCVKFVAREARRGRRYDAVIMDPPSFGRGPTGEVWKLEDDVFTLASACAGILSDTPLFFLVNCYTTGLQPTVAADILKLALSGRQGAIEAYELGLPVRDGGGIILPAGCSALALFG
ncbi:MAG: class I SAM-dependent methyltransferase [Firmicutes bacterium]|nr:class I SAM-dependent methyltransferase [Bacillota bacterium]